MVVENSSDKPGLLKSVKPFIAAAAVISTGSVLVVAIYFTLLDLEWIAFLAGVLFAAILAMVTQATRAEFAATSRAERLAIAEDRLSRETQRREKLEEQLASARTRLRFSDDSMPVMLAFIDDSLRYVYHNRAYRNWVGLQAESIDGQHMRDVLGRKVFAEVEAYVFEAAGGRIVCYERTHKTPTGALYRLSVQFLPQFGQGATYTGFYAVVTDITEHHDLRSLLAGTENFPDTLPQDGRTPISPAGSPAGGNTVTLPTPASAETSDWQIANQRILAAINGNEFTLFCQRIMPLVSGATTGHYEVLIRLLEEEDSMIPPGAFFPLAEEHGLLPQLDRWVFAHTLDWMTAPAGADSVRDGSIYFINVATQTISDPEFPEFVEYQLRRTGVNGRSVCMEIAEPDLTRNQGDAVQFVQTIKQCGCLVAISGFGRVRVPVETLKMFPVDFLKIDGSIVRQILAFPTYKGRAIAINRVATAIGIRTIAEMVEDEGTLAILRELKVDYAQGFGISRPIPLADLK